MLVYLPGVDATGCQMVVVPEKLGWVGRDLT